MHMGFALKIQTLSAKRTLGAKPKIRQLIYIHQRFPMLNTYNSNNNI